MKKIMILAMVVAINSIAPIFAQEIAFNKDYTTGLKIGQKVPDMYLQSELPLMEEADGKIHKIRLSDYKGKLIILDFWSLHCPSCIAAFPKMEKLQKEFNKDIQVLLVNRDARSRIDQGDRILRKFKLPDLPALSPEAYILLSQIFPHRTIPHHVWIDGDGKVIAITNGYNATRENIQKFLDGKPGHLFQKIDIPDRDILHKQSMLQILGDNDLLATSQYLSWLSPRSEMMNSVVAKIGYVDSLHQTYRTSYPNYEVVDLFRIAFAANQYKGLENFNADNRLVMNFADAARFFRPDSLKDFDEWAQGMQFNYEQILPLRDTANRFLYMQQDLNRYFGVMFGVKVRVEKRSLPCIVVKTNDPVVSGLAKEHAGRSIAKSDPESGRSWQARQISGMISSLYYFTAKKILKEVPTPFVSEISSDLVLHFNLKNTYKDFEELKSELKPYGVLLSIEKREIPMLVFEKTAQK